MSGYLLQLYEEARPSDYTKVSFEKYFQYAKKQNSNNNLEYVTYGEFNRLEISVVDSFRDFRTIPDNSRKWLGRRQSVLLYEISQDDKRLEYIQDSDKHIFYFKENKTGKIAKQHFLVFAMLSFTNEMIKQISDFSIFIKQVRKHVLKVVDQAKKNAEAMTNEYSDICSIQCEVLGSFNTSEIGLFIFCNQYVDALRIIEFIRCMEINLDENKKCKIFFHSFSFVSKNKYKEQENQNEKYYLIESEDDIKGTAAFQISLKCSCNSKILNSLKEKLGEPIKPKHDKKSLYFTSVGEQDILGIIPAGRAMMYFQKSTNNDDNIGLFLFGSQKNNFDMMILQKNVRLLYESRESVLHRAFLQMEQDEYITMPENQKEQSYIKQEKTLPKLLFPDIQNSDTETDEILKKYQKIRKKMNYFAKSIGAVNTLDLLYTDYLSTIAYTYNAIWTLDFQKQFDAILNVIESMLEDVNNDGEWNWDLYRELINNFKQQIYHLSQSNRTFLEFPSCHIRYTGQQDYLLHAYFGVIKKILQIVYLTHEKDSQSELIPLITVDVVPIVNSTLYYEGKKSSEARVMNLNIPNDIMFNFPRGIYYLAHELYHYVAPYDRTRRNQLLTCIMLDEIMLRQIIHIFEIIFQNEIKGLYGCLNKDKDNELHQFLLSYLVLYFRDIVWKYIYENYNSINNQIEQLLETVSTPLVSSQLFLALIKYVRRDKNNDILKHFKKVFNKCFEELESRSNGFQYETFIKKISSNKEENLGIKDSNIYSICLNILQYYYADKKAFNSILENIFQSGYIFSNAPEEVQDIEWVYNGMWHGINEAVRDVAMITIMDISLSEYLIFVLQCWFDLQIADHVISEEQICRLGSIFMYYFHKAKSRNKSAEDYRNEQRKLFIQRYVMIYYENFQMYDDTSTDITNSQIHNYTLKDIFGKAEKCWIDLYKSFDDYIERYSYYDIYVQEMFLNMDIGITITNMKESEKDEEDKKAIYELESLCNEFKSKVTETYNNANKHFLEAVNFSVLKNKSDGNVSTEKKVIKKKYSEYEKEIFECNLNIAHYFQKQKRISSLYDKSRKLSEKRLNDKPSEQISVIRKNNNTNKKRSPVWIYTIYDQKKLLPFLQTLSGKLEPDSNINYNSLWYRGETAANRAIIPALFWKFVENNSSFCARYKSMRNFIEQAVEEFRFREDGSNALPNQLKYTSTEYVTLLQHYEVNTHFLDWSEDAIAALYFALEKYLNNERLNGEPIPNRPVQVMIFDPKKYNSIRSKLLEKFLQKDETHNHVLEYQKNLENRIPNLSLVENQTMFGEFLPFLHENMECTLISDKFKFVRYLPIAIWSSKLNDRLSAQNGSFVAFNLETPLDICKQISLENIQKEVLQYWENNYFTFGEGAPVFLYIVKIDKTICRDMAKWLRAIGMSTERLYPELKNIGNRINPKDMPLDEVM